MAKKTAKTQPKKQTKRKSTRRSMGVSIAGYPTTPTLDEKRNRIIRRVPVVPCSAISRDIHGLRFAHTQAERIFALYQKEMLKENMKILPIGGECTTTVYTDEVTGVEGVEYVERHASRVVCNYEAVCNDTGERHHFWCAGMGSNLVWSDTSATTVAMKQAILLYFGACWPQPTDWAEVVKDSLLALKPDDRLMALKMIVPPTMVDAVRELLDYFGKEIGK